MVLHRDALPSRLPRSGGNQNGGRKGIRETQEGCGGLGGENPAAFPKAGPIFQQPFSLPESAQTLVRIVFRAAGESGNNFPAASRFAGKPFQQGILDSHSLLEFSEGKPQKCHNIFRQMSRDFVTRRDIK